MSSRFDKVCREFQCEWSTGRKAKLTLECHAGQARALLELSLGLALGEAGLRTRTRPPSYARRQEIRRDAKVAINAMS